jgi:hypothetical protein
VDALGGPGFGRVGFLRIYREQPRCIRCPLGLNLRELGWRKGRRRTCTPAPVTMVAAADGAAGDTEAERKCPTRSPACCTATRYTPAVTSANCAAYTSARCVATGGGVLRAASSAIEAEITVFEF